MSTESLESCPFTRSIWLLTRKGIFLLLLLFPSAPTRGTAAFLDMKHPSLTTWQSVTSSSQPSLKVSFATHLTLQSWRNKPNQANPMDFSFLWTPTLINWALMLRTPRQEILRCSSTHLAQSSMLGSGSYGMSSLKRMTGTESFKRLPDGQKKCFVHNREECQTRKYLDQVKSECMCTPWALQPDQGKNQVKTRSFKLFSTFER